MLWENLTSLIVAFNTLFGHPEAPLMEGVLAIAVLGGFAIGGPILYWIFRPDPTTQLAKTVSPTNEPENPALADALQMGQVGETVGSGIDEVDEDSSPVPFAYSVIPPRRQVIRWLDDNTVRATTRYRRPFYGEVIRRGRPRCGRNWVLLRREGRGNPIWCRLPAPM